MFDFGIGATELMLIAVVALLVVGPKDLPRLMRWVGNAVARVRALAREFQGHLDEAMRDTGIDEIRDGVGKMKEYAVADLDAEFEKLEKEFRDTALPASATEGEGENAADRDGEGSAREVLSLDEDVEDDALVADHDGDDGAAGAEATAQKGDEDGAGGEVGEDGKSDGGRRA